MLPGRGGHASPSAHSERAPQSIARPCTPAVATVPSCTVVSGAAISWWVITACVGGKRTPPLPARPQKGSAARRKLVWFISLIGGTYLIRGTPGVCWRGAAAGPSGSPAAPVALAAPSSPRDRQGGSCRAPALAGRGNGNHMAMLCLFITGSTVLMAGPPATPRAAPGTPHEPQTPSQGHKLEPRMGERCKPFQQTWGVQVGAGVPPTRSERPRRAREHGRHCLRTVNTGT